MQALGISQNELHCDLGVCACSGGEGGARPSVCQGLGVWQTWEEADGGLCCCLRGTAQRCENKELSGPGTGPCPGR